jgi:DNA-binding transcriptional ArsR family regulator
MLEMDEQLPLKTESDFLLVTGNPCRAKILMILVTTQNPLNVGAIAELVGFHISTTSSHLGKLFEQRLVSRERLRTQQLYQVNRHQLRRTFALLQGPQHAVGPE